jgi:hypothetical protein
MNIEVSNNFKIQQKAIKIAFIFNSLHCAFIFSNRFKY